MYVLYVTGHSALDEGTARILGISHRGGSFVVFIDRADRGDDLLVTTAEMEGAGLVHESGHLLGLVGSGVPMTSNHVDPHSVFHDADPNSIMFRIVQVPTTIPNLGDEDFAQFNKACVDDLQAFGGLALAGQSRAGARWASSRRPTGTSRSACAPAGSKRCPASP